MRTRTTAMAARCVFASAMVVALVIVGCRRENRSRPEPLFERMSPERTGIRFVNQIEESAALNVVTYEPIYNGAGVGVGDVDRDGRQDLFFASNMGASRLYLNRGDFRFDDATDTAGIRTEGRWVNGVAMVDVNHDGYLDIYLSCGGPFADPQRRANALYVNNGDNTFSERAETYGLADTGHTTQAAFFDYDRDGDLDVYLLTNGIGEMGPNVIRPKKTEGQAINTDRLYRNNGDGTFTDVSASAGIRMEGYGLGLAIFDVNRDGWPDVYVANDYLSNDLLYVNNQDGTFTDRAAAYFRHQSYAAMGTDVADVNNDGLMDVVTLDMLPERNERLMLMYETAGYERYRSELLSGYDPQVKRNTLQLNTGLTPDGEPSFSEVGRLAGVHATDWSWSALLADFDNDGWRDLFVTNGIPRDITNREFANYKVQLLQRNGYNRRTLQALVDRSRELESVRTRNYLFKNNGGLAALSPHRSADVTQPFIDKSEAWGVGQPSFSTGAAYADLDNDGDLDLVVNNTDDEAFVYRNRAERRGRSYLNVQLSGPRANPRGLGARVSVHYGDGRSQHAVHSVYRGYRSTVAPTVHFGLDTVATVDSLVVVWPDGKVQTRSRTPANQTVEVAYAEAADRARPGGGGRASDTGTPPMFTEVPAAQSIPFTHEEQHYNDFKMQPLLPHKFSQGGPGMAVGDVNGDGRDDVYVGGAFEQAGRVYLQRPNGTFAGSDLASGPNYEEDMGALFFDANGDGHLDLYVASGGSEFKAGSPYYQDRLYRGDGTGRFQRADDALPEMTSSSSVVVAGDYDRDGDLDLFVGGRVVPNRYPAAPESHLLENRDGTFVDVTSQMASALQTSGLITAALWTDFDDDGWLDLILAGEWMPITAFENRKGRLVNVTADLGLAQTVGWWNSIAAGDFDRDGDTDYVAGNLGLNTRLKNKPEGPVRMHVSDFNGDRRLDAVLSRVTGGERDPLHFRNDVLAQIPTLEKRFPSYSSYAQAEVKDLFGGNALSEADVYESDTFRTSLIENQSGTAFEVRALPVQAQFAPVFGITSGEYDGDGARDLLMIGNSHATEAFRGPSDAFNGLLLRGDGRGGFTSVRMPNSGFYVAGDGKALAEVAVGGARHVLAAQNDGALKTFRTRADSTKRLLRIQPSEMWAEVTYEGGGTEKVEFYYGSGYLSQSSRTLAVSDDVKEVTLSTLQGPSRTWTP